MKKVLRITGKILGITAAALAVLTMVLLLVRFIGQKMLDRTPKGGINESGYADINGTKMWINIYGQDKDNPVMLYLHGGPGFATSGFDYPILRKLSADYTVVNWDQRGAGKSQINYPYDGELTSDLLREDLLETVEYILDRTGKEKLTILGSSWGTLYGGDFALEHPELVECFIGTSQVVDLRDIYIGLKKHALEWTKDCEEDRQRVLNYDPEDFSDENMKLCHDLRKKYCVSDNFFKDSDFDVIAAMFFDPYYSLSETFKLVKSLSSSSLGEQYDAFMYTEKNGRKVLNENGLQDFSLKGRTDYKMPVFIRTGRYDFQTDPYQAKAYFDEINAPYKEFRYVDGGHFLPLIDSEGLAEFVKNAKEKMYGSNR